MANKKERHPNAMFIVSGYSVIIYCQYCMKHYEDAGDGPESYSQIYKRIRRLGWTIHKDGFCTCKDCK